MRTDYTELRVFFALERRIFRCVLFRIRISFLLIFESCNIFKDVINNHILAILNYKIDKCSYFVI